MQWAISKSLAAALATLLLSMSFAGCGQKGPLVLPAPPGAASAGGR